MSKEPEPRSAGRIEPIEEERAASESREEGKEGKKKKPAGSDYVFKIVRADPKNSFDFEDVADK